MKKIMAYESGNLPYPLALYHNEKGDQTALYDVNGVLLTSVQIGTLKEMALYDLPYTAQPKSHQYMLRQMQTKGVCEIVERTFDNSIHVYEFAVITARGKEVLK